MFEMLVGLNVTNDSEYTKYREGMTPILKSIGGDFGYDFKIAEILKSECKDKINRVFTIKFPHEEAMEKFFADEKYLSIRENLFNNSVESTTIISTYTRS